MNETRFNEIYTENRLKRFRTRDVRIEDVEEKKLNLTLIQRDVKKFKRRAETAEENSEEKFKMLKKKSD